MNIIVDVEADGPCPGLYSMVSIGAVVVHNEQICETHYGEFAPLENALWVPEALAVSGKTREEHEQFTDPALATNNLYTWLTGIRTKYKANRLFFLSDNNGFDWQFVNYYLWKYENDNPFGHSSINISSLYKGMVRSMFKNHKHLRLTKHTHHPVDDATGNAEALIAMKKQGLKIHL